MKKNYSKLIVIMLVFSMLLSLAGCSKTTDKPNNNNSSDNSTNNNSDKGTENSGSEPTYLNIAMDDEPLTLDTTLKTYDAAVFVAQEVFECLYVYDENYVLQPMLVENESISDDGKRIEINLRQNVKFHDGSEMVAEDVKASLDRWLQYGTKAQEIASYIDNIEIINDYAIALNFNSIYSTWKDMFSFYSGACWITPKEIAEEAGKEALMQSQYIGTGPYKFVEQQNGRYIKLAKFDEYTSRTEAPSGPAGAREAIVDELYFHFIIDISTRLNGLKTGEYDYARLLSGDLYESVSSTSGIVTTLNSGTTHGFFFLNLRSELLKDNDKMSQAILMALSMDEILAAGWGSPELWKATASWYPEGNPYYSLKGTELYNTGDPEAARQLAAEAGYNGEKIRILTNTSYPTFVNATAVALQQLTAAGFDVEEKRMDGTSLISLRSDESAWEMFFTHHKMSPQPFALNPLNPGYAGWWDTDERFALGNEYLVTMDDYARYEIWHDIQALTYEQVPVIRIGEWSDYDAYSEKISGLPEQFSLYPHFWGINIDR